MREEGLITPSTYDAQYILPNRIIGITCYDYIVIFLYIFAVFQYLFRYKNFENVL